MPWHAIYRLSDGALYSVGEGEINSLPEGYAAKDLPDRPDFSILQWNSETLAFDPVAAPPPDPDVEATTAVLEQLGVIQSTGGVIPAGKIPIVEADQTQQILTLLTFLVQREMARG